MKLYGFKHQHLLYIDANIISKIFINEIYYYGVLCKTEEDVINLNALSKLIEIYLYINTHTELKYYDISQYTSLAYGVKTKQIFIEQHKIPYYMSFFKLIDEDCFCFGFLLSKNNNEYMKYMIEIDNLINYKFNFLQLP